MPTMFSIPAVLTVAAGGALIAFAAYRRLTKRRSRDLRAELCAERESLRAAIEALTAKIDLAKRSRTAAAFAAGRTGPAALQQWLHEVDLDLTEVEHLRSQLPADDSDYSALSDMDLEIELVEVLALSLRASALAEKYRSSISPQGSISPQDSISAQGRDRQMLADDAEALIPEPAQFSVNNSASSIVESIV